jgi:hypothetical protein
MAAGAWNLMMYRVRLGANRVLRAALLWSLLLLPFEALSGPAALADPAPLPSKVNALYRISFGLLGEIGYFQFKSIIDGEAYTLAAEARIDTAVFDYSGVMSSTGAVLSAVTKPIGYKFRYKQKALLGKKKVKSLDIAFKNSSVADVTFVPPEDRETKKIVPVTSEQLKYVLDPLSGVMALSLGNIDKPCDQMLPIFDGKQRFNLVFAPTGRSVGATADRVCRVRLVPISGHKKGEGADSVISGNIEVVMRRVPKANIMIPYRVTVPTIIGDAVLASEKVDITMPDRQRIALGR